MENFNSFFTKLSFFIKIFNKVLWISKKKEQTPLHYAIEKNEKEIGKLLISKGANINAKDLNYLNKELLFFNIGI